MIRPQKGDKTPQNAGFWSTWGRLLLQQFAVIGWRTESLSENRGRFIEMGQSFDPDCESRCRFRRL
jgi:hypothetical protein